MSEKMILKMTFLGCIFAIFSYYGPIGMHTMILHYFLNFMFMWLNYELSLCFGGELNSLSLNDSTPNFSSTIHLKSVNKPTWLVNSQGKVGNKLEVNQSKVNDSQLFCVL